MTIQRLQVRRLFAVLAVLAFFAVACGDATSTGEETASVATDTADSAPQIEAVEPVPTVASAAAEAAPTAVFGESETAEAVAEESSDDSAPAATGQLVATVDGGQLDLGSLEGQDTVLWFWAPW